MIVALCGCGPIDAGKIADGGPVAAWPPDAVSFVATSSPSYFGPACPNADGGVDGSRWEVTLGTGLTDLTVCEAADGGARVRSGSHRLTATERSELETALNALLQSKLGGCGYDKSELRLEVATPGGVVKLRDDFYTCRTESGSTTVSGIDAVFAVLGKL